MVLERLIVGLPAKGARGNHDNPISNHQYQGTVTLIEISGEQVSWDLPILTKGKGGGGAGAKAIEHVKTCEQMLDLCTRAVNHLEALQILLVHP